MVSTFTQRKLYSEASRDREAVRTIKAAKPGDPWYRGPRDPVTGEANVLDTARRPVGFFARERDYHQSRDTHDRQPLPRKIHCREMEHSGASGRRREDYLGSHAFHQTFRRYLAHPSVMPVLSPQAEHTNCWQWYKLAYVGQGMLKAFKSVREREMLAAVILVRRDGYELETVVNTFTTSAPITHMQFARFERRLALHAKTQYGLPGYIGPATQVWHAPDVHEYGPMTTGEVAG